tara:strand:- start:834 stop:1037 length:204 start_codon:yes stop_codon:yes gene_type:complete
MNLPQQPMCRDMFSVSEIREVVFLFCPTGVSGDDMMAIKTRANGSPLFFKALTRFHEVVVEGVIDSH